MLSFDLHTIVWDSLPMSPLTEWEGSHMKCWVAQVHRGTTSVALLTAKLLSKLLSTIDRHWYALMLHSRSAQIPPASVAWNPSTNMAFILPLLLSAIVQVVDIHIARASTSLAVVILSLWVILQWLASNMFLIPFQICYCCTSKFHQIFHCLTAKSIKI